MAGAMREAGDVFTASDSPWAALSPSTRRVALELLVHGPLARTQLAQRLDLSTASLTRITKPLLDLGVLLDMDETTPSDGGRPLQPLDVDPHLQCFVGIKLAGTKADAVLTNLRADILDSRTVDVPDRDPEVVVELLASVAAELAGSGPSPAAVGIALGGAVRDYSTVLSAPFLRWRGVALGRALSAATGLPAVISNDLDALMEAEHWFGDGRDVGNFAALTIGAGVGVGLVVHDRLVAGRDSGLGLLEHFPIDPLGPACRLGHRGCAEALITTEGIVTQAGITLGRAVGYDDVLALCAAGDPVADHIVGRAAHALGTLIAAVANIAQPELVVVTGEGIHLARLAWERVLAGVRQARPPEASEVDIRVLDDDPYLWARGAAAVAIQRTVLATVGGPTAP